MNLTIADVMGRRESIQKLVKFYPDAKAIVPSCYSNDFVLAQYEHCGYREFPRNPMNDLGDVVLQKVLRSGSQQQNRISARERNLS